MPGAQLRNVRYDMATAYWKLDVNSEVSAADVPSHLGHGAFLVLRTDNRPGATTIYFSGDEKEIASAKLAARPVTLESVMKP